MELKKGKFDWVLFLLVAFLLLFSISVVYSSSAAYAEFKFGEYSIFFRTHLRNVILSFLSIIISYKISYQYWKKWAIGLLILSTFLLLVVLIYNNPVKGANRWIDLGLINFQPSELAKFALIVYIAKIISERYEIKDDILVVAFPVFFWIFLFCGLIALQPNFSTSLVFFFISICLLLIGKIRIKYLFNFSVFFLLLGLIYAFSASYRVERISGFLGFIRSTEKSNIVYQTYQALIALGNGGLWGLGPGKSRQSHLFLPESYGDYIFSIVGEEYGFLGIIALFLFFFLILLKIYKISKSCSELFPFLLVSGILISLSTYTIVNAMVNIGLLPATGLPMPFISYGGSAVIIYGLMIGIVLNINKSNKEKAENSLNEY